MALGSRKSSGATAAEPKSASPPRSAPESTSPARPPAPRDPDTMIPARSKRRGAESVLVRLVATFGIIAIGTALGAILVSQHVAGWIVGLVVATVSVLVAAVLWSSRRV